MNILHIDSGILGEHSVSRRLTAAVIERLRAEHPEATVVTHDLVAEPVGHLTGADLGAAPAGRDVLAEFLAADVVVVGAPMYNFTIPTQLKAWIDRLLVAGKTFRYTETGPEGLAGGRKVIIASARGGVYSEGAPAASLDHQEPFLQSVLNFIGVTDIEIVRAEGLAMGAEAKAAAVDAALADIASRESLRQAA
ncbi:FMN-dependent NADH-azoreductase [Rhizobium rhizosphaerae]|uniref:FMN dependent NADH:quinone oxidoreductase n=1 Tax=Xaviernesmea rhizosphaerae TaxID=1672749 RepID=A0A1Q9AJQ5_9HYPH|nr:FMN-dependent NADH-azoreductase [Xaviernesmea rhizosphaerae]OLP55424.1 FMN-dependent NADH-azoreductase [Xaviernesmea rhizosphaerae]OQP85523.1 FMN-dependent NADH-azoreductase [Xaviernesmea rhizosphaerae]